MTKQETELHEKFLRGITLKMILWGVFLVGSVVTTFWTGYYAIASRIDKNNQRIERVQLSSIKREDSLQNIDELAHKDIWNAVDSKQDKPGYKSRGFIIETYHNGRHGDPDLKRTN